MALFAPHIDVSSWESVSLKDCALSQSNDFYLPLHFKCSCENWSTYIWYIRHVKHSKMDCIIPFRHVLRRNSSSVAFYCCFMCMHDFMLLLWQDLQRLLSYKSHQYGTSTRFIDYKGQTYKTRISASMLVLNTGRKKKKTLKKKLNSVGMLNFHNIILNS